MPRTRYISRFPSPSARARYSRTRPDTGQVPRSLQGYNARAARRYQPTQFSGYGNVSVPGVLNDVRDTAQEMYQDAREAVQGAAGRAQSVLTTLYNSPLLDPIRPEPPAPQPSQGDKMFQVAILGGLGLLIILAGVIIYILLND